MPRRHPCACALLLPTLLGLGSFAGCSMTSGARTAERPKFRTIASLGDRPLPPVTGEPGSSVVTGEIGPDPKRNPRAQISGRVVDDRGRPVANAVVRPAEGGLTGGRVAEAITDRAGGFTLHGLRPGNRYTLIAESDAKDGRKIGRVDVASAETGVEESLLELCAPGGVLACVPAGVGGVVAGGVFVDHASQRCGVLPPDLAGQLAFAGTVEAMPPLDVLDTESDRAMRPRCR